MIFVELPRQYRIGFFYVCTQHLETGTGTVSLKVFIAIVNYLDCSVDELLCKEIKTAKPYVNSWLADLVSDCDQSEIKIIADTVTALKQTLKKNRPEDL